MILDHLDRRDILERLEFLEWWVLRVPLVSLDLLVPQETPVVLVSQAWGVILARLAIQEHLAGPASPDLPVNLAILVPLVRGLRLVDSPLPVTHKPQRFRNAHKDRRCSGRATLCSMCKATVVLVDKISGSRVRASRASTQCRLCSAT